MISSGIKRGLAATAISAMAVTGLPLLATSASAAHEATLDVTSRDGAAFDDQEFNYTPTAPGDGGAGAANSDIVGQINNSTGNPVVGAEGAGRTVNYRWVVTPFDGVPSGVDSGQTQSGTVTTDDQGKFSIPRPLVIDDDGTWKLFVSLADDGAGPGKALPEREALTVKASDSTLRYDETSPEQATSGTSETVSGSLKLADGTGLAGRSVKVDYNNGGGTNNANIVQANGTTGPTRTVTTDANGNWSVVVQDPAASPQPEENGTIQASTVPGTVDNDDPAESAGAQAVQFIQSEAPAKITITPDDNGLDRPGEIQDYTVTVTNDTGDALNNSKVTLTIDHGFFTDGTADPAPASGADTGEFKSLGQTITVTTNGSGQASFKVAIERDAGFDDDGLVTGIIKATDAGASDTEDQKWTSSDPLNGGAVQVVFSPANQQQSGVLPKAPIDDFVKLDVLLTDQFGNAVGGEPYTVSDNTGQADVSGDSVSDFALDGDLVATSRAQVDQTVTVTWTTATNTYSSATPPAPVPGSETLTGTKTINWYTVDFANSTFTLTHTGADTQPVGSTVTETYTALDQFGEPISELYVKFFRSGPDQQQDGDGNADGLVGQDGKIQYVYQGTQAGTATVTGVGFENFTFGNTGDVVEGSKRSDSVTFGATTPPGVFQDFINAKLVGENNGARPDKLRVNGPGQAAEHNMVGAKVRLFRFIKGGDGRMVKVATGFAKSNGNINFTVKDKNGKKYSKYIAKVSETTSAFRTTTNTKRVR